MLDFTKEVRLAPEWQKRYAAARLAMLAVFIFGGLLFANLLLFPTFIFSVPLGADGSQLDLMKALRDARSGELSDNGNLEEGKVYAFDASFDRRREISTILLGADLASGSAAPDDLKVSVRKSYRAFLSEPGEPLGFKDGTLLRSGGDFYIASGGSLRKFSSEKILRELGYAGAMFAEASPKDLSYGKVSEDITDSSSYPDGALIRIGETHYQFRAGELAPFASKEAFLTHYEPNMAITKSETFLNGKKISAENIGFADGSLVSTKSGVLIISGGKKYPIGSPQIFEAMGFDWSDVIPSTEGALAGHAKEPLFTQFSIHPDGTVFKDAETGKHFMMMGNRTRLLPTEAIALSYLKRKPVIVSERSLAEKKECLPSRQLFASNTYECSASVEDLAALPGNSYQLELESRSSMKLSRLSAELQTTIGKKSLKQTLSSLKRNIIDNYYAQTK